MKRNVTLVVMFVALLALAGTALGQTVPLNISSGFNMKVWESPAIYQNCQAKGTNENAYYGA